MKIGEQIKARRVQAGLAVAALAQQVGVSEQAVRYWEAGRSDPSKEVARRVEAALDMRLDWSEGAGQPAKNVLIPSQDIDLLLLLGQLPYEAKLALSQIVRLLVDAQSRGARLLREREEAPPAKPFSEKTSHAPTKKTGARRASR